MLTSQVSSRPRAFTPAVNARLAGSRSARQLLRLASVHRHARCQAGPDGQPSLSTPASKAVPGLGAGYASAIGGNSTVGEPRPRVAASAADEMAWDDWSQFFDEMDEAASRVNLLDDQLQAAVAAEDYAEAAMLKRELDQLLAKDSVANILKELEVALGSEEYSRASQLRDEGGAGLLGWWCGRGTEDDPYGHLLHVTSDFGRYVGTAYQAKDLAEHKGWTEDNFLRGVLDRTPRNLAELGTPVMEVFVQEREGGSFTKQVCALAPAEDVTESELTVTLSDPDQLSDITVQRGETDDGQYVQISLSYPDGPEELGQPLQGPQDDLDFPSISGSGSLEDNILSSSSLFSGSLDGPLGEAEEEVEFLMQRQQATLQTIGLDSFEFEVLPSPEDEAAGDALSTGPSGAGEGSLQQGQQQPGDTPAVASSSNGMGSVGDVAGFRNTLVKFAQESAKLAGKDAKSQEEVDEFAEQVEEIRKVTRDLVGSGASPAGITISEVNLSGPMPLTGKVRYARLTPQGARTDPLTGLYIGAFGPHGPELLQLSRGTWQDGEEAVYGVKVTGDPNVPAGSLSFRAKVGRRHRLEPSEEYPPDLGVVVRYKGEGRIAATGYRNPRWVEGELLQFSSNSPVTRGAQLGFVWSVPGEKKFLILLNKVDLDN